MPTGRRAKDVGVVLAERHVRITVAGKDVLSGDLALPIEVREGWRGFGGVAIAWIEVHKCSLLSSITSMKSGCTTGSKAGWPMSGV